MICDCCRSHKTIECELAAIRAENAHAHDLLHSILVAVVPDPVQLDAAKKALAALRADSARLKAAVSAAPKSPV